MRLAEMGQWRDITVEVVSMSGSSALLRTGMTVSGMEGKEVEGRGGWRKAYFLVGLVLWL